MALPTQKRTSSSKKQRAINFRLKKTNYTYCPKCNRPILPHHACKFCGTYAGKDILEIKIKHKKGTRRSKEEKEATKNKEKKS